MEGQTSPLGDDLQEPVIGLGNDLLPDLPLLVGEGIVGAAHVLQFTALDDDHLHAHLVQELLQVGDHGDHPNAPGQGAGAGEDEIGRRRNVVSAGGG